MNSKLIHSLTFMLIVFFLLSACGRSEPTAAPYTPEASPPTVAPKPTESIAGDPVVGKEVFERECRACHTTDTKEAVAGPSLYGAGNVYDPDYVRRWINHPVKEKVYESEADKPNPDNKAVMPENIVENLTAAELEDVIAYVLSLK